MSGLRYKLPLYTIVASFALIIPTLLFAIYVNDNINTVYGYTGIYIGSITVIFICTSYFINRLVIKPVNSLVSASRQLSTGQYDIQLPSNQQDEIGKLVESYNELHNTLKRTVQRQSYETESLNEILVELKASEVRANAIFSSVQDGIILTDALGIIEAVNQALCDMTGYQRQELLGSSVDILIPKKHRPKHQQRIVNFVLDKARPVRDYMRLDVRHKDGTTNPIELSISQISSEGKHNLVAVIHDVTERIKAERELRIERDRAQSYLDTAEVAIISIDIACKVTLVNRKCCELLGYSEDELIGKNYFDLCPDREVADELQQEYLSHVTNNDVFPKFFYINLLTKEGKTRIFEWHNNTVKDYEWNTTGIILAGTDMTEFRKSIDDRKALRDRLYQSQKMQAIGQLSSGIAHDFNNLLATMMGYTELLQDMLSDNNDESVKTYLQEIYTSGERARDLIEGILKYSRGAKNNETEYLENLYLPGLCQEIKNMLHGVLPNDIDISMHFRQDTYEISIDSIKLQQLIMNLCLNAAEAMQEGGKLVLAATNADNYQGCCASCAKTFTGDYLGISITDTGCGIESNALTHLFEPFYTTKVVGEVGQGAGMGLPIVHGLVHEANGHIIIDSKPGIGTTISIMFPAAIVKDIAISAQA